MAKKVTNIPTFGCMRLSDKLILTIMNTSMESPRYMLIFSNTCYRKHGMVLNSVSNQPIPGVSGNSNTPKKYCHPRIRYCIAIGYCPTPNTPPNTHQKILTFWNTCEILLKSNVKYSWCYSMNKIVNELQSDCTFAYRHLTDCYRLQHQDMVNIPLRLHSIECV